MLIILIYRTYRLFAFREEANLNGWRKIGVSPFDRRVYWDLVVKEKTKEKVTTTMGYTPATSDLLNDVR